MHETTFIIEANTMNPDQTAPKGAVWSGSLLFAILATKVHIKQMRMQTTTVVLDGKGDEKELSEVSWITLPLHIKIKWISSSQNVYVYDLDHKVWWHGPKF